MAWLRRVRLRLPARGLRLNGSDPGRSGRVRAHRGRRARRAGRLQRRRAGPRPVAVRSGTGHRRGAGEPRRRAASRRSAGPALGWRRPPGRWALDARPRCLRRLLRPALPGLTLTGEVDADAAEPGHPRAPGRAGARLCPRLSPADTSSRARDGGAHRRGRTNHPEARAYAEGKEVRFIHTEASDRAVADMLTRMMGGSQVLVVPALGQVPDAALGDVYVFTNGIRGEGSLGYQPDVVDRPPGALGYSPVRWLVRVTWPPGTTARVLRSAAEVPDAASRGEVTLERTEIVVNMPLVTWPGGQREPSEPTGLSLGNLRCVSRPSWRVRASPRKVAVESAPRSRSCRGRSAHARCRVARPCLQSAWLPSDTAGMAALSSSRVAPTVTVSLGQGRPGPIRGHRYPRGVMPARERSASAHRQPGYGSAEGAAERRVPSRLDQARWVPERGSGKPARGDGAGGRVGRRPGRRLAGQRRAGIARTRGRTSRARRSSASRSRALKTWK